MKEHKEGVYRSSGLVNSLFICDTLKNFILQIENITEIVLLCYCNHSGSMPSIITIQIYYLSPSTSVATSVDYHTQEKSISNRLRKNVQRPPGKWIATYFFKIQSIGLNDRNYSMKNKGKIVSWLINSAI